MSSVGSNSIKRMHKEPVQKPLILLNTQRAQKEPKNPNPGSPATDNQTPPPQPLYQMKETVIMAGTNSLFNAQFRVQQSFDQIYTKVGNATTTWDKLVAEFRGVAGAFYSADLCSLTLLISNKSKLTTNFCSLQSTQNKLLWWNHFIVSLVVSQFYFHLLICSFYNFVRRLH